MNHTQNLHLPQWEKTDRLMMDDFNDAMASIDAAVAAKVNSADLPAAIAAASPYATICDYTVQSAGSTRIDLDVSAIDFTQYMHIDLLIESPGYASSYSVKVLTNGQTSGYYFQTPMGNGQNTTHWLSVPVAGVSYCGLFSLPATGGQISSFGFNGMSFSYNSAPTRWDELTTLNFLLDTNSSISAYPVGTHILIKGLKK